MNSGLSKNKIAVILSKNNQEKFEDKYPDSIETNTYANNVLINKSMLPSETNVLLTTSKLKEGISIKNDDIKNIICESHNISDIIQYMGRVRSGISCFLVVSNSEIYPSKINDLEYDYCIKQEYLACNRYYHSIVGIDSEQEKFIDFIENKFQYLKFNYFDKNFEPYDLKYIIQQQNDNSQKTWNHDLKIFCNKHNIKFIDINYGKRKYYKNMLSSLVGKELYDQDWKDAVEYFHIAYYINYKASYKINKELEIKKIPLKIVECRGKGDNRNKRGKIILRN